MKPMSNKLLSLFMYNVDFAFVCWFIVYFLFLSQKWALDILYLCLCECNPIESMCTLAHSTIQKSCICRSMILGLISYANILKDVCMQHNIIKYTIENCMEILFDNCTYKTNILSWWCHFNKLFKALLYIHIYKTLKWILYTYIHRYTDTNYTQRYESQKVIYNGFHLAVYVIANFYIFWMFNLTNTLI